MNRDALHSASLGAVVGGGGGTDPRVYVEPRPASDPGDENSDLGSDAGWHLTVGSDSDGEPTAAYEDEQTSLHPRHQQGNSAPLEVSNSAIGSLRIGDEAAERDAVVASTTSMPPLVANAPQGPVAPTESAPIAVGGVVSGSSGDTLDRGREECEAVSEPRKYEAPVISNSALPAATGGQVGGDAAVATAEAAAAAAAAADEDDELGMINIIRGFQGIKRTTAQTAGATLPPPSAIRGIRYEPSAGADGLVGPPGVAIPAPSSSPAGLDASSGSENHLTVDQRGSVTSGTEALEDLGGADAVSGAKPRHDKEADGRAVCAGLSSSKEGSPESWIQRSGPRLLGRASVTSSESSTVVASAQQSLPSHRLSDTGGGESGTPVGTPMLTGSDARGSPGLADAMAASAGTGRSSQVPQPLVNPSFMRPPATSSGSAAGLADRSSVQVPGAASVPLSASSEFTILECVVEMLKGSSCLKRRNFFQVTEANAWLDPDMSAIRYRTVPKKGPVQEDKLVVAKVRRISNTDREIKIWVDEKKSVDFILPTKERACVWLSGLCCLVPARASIKSHSKYKQVTERRALYDPLSDYWNGKPLTDRKWFKQYILLGSIGRGAFGKVKIALSRSDFRFYAVKVLSKAMMRKQNRNSAFERVSNHGAPLAGYAADGEAALDVNEVTVMRKLNHPNVVKLYDTYDDVVNDRLFIVLEYVANGPVMNSSKLSGAIPVSKSQVRPIFVDAVAGLMYLHSQGVVHRDFKPENLLLAGDQRAKISDFGSAKAYGESEILGKEEATPSAQRTTVGTPAFTAPELCLSEKSPRVTGIPFAADIWSLGATLYYMCYGRAPFLAKSVFEMYDAICSLEVQFPPGTDLSGPIPCLLRTLLEKNPGRRATFRDILFSPFLADGMDAQVQARVEALRTLL